MSPTTEISNLISFSSKLILGVPVVRPSFLFVEHNKSSHDQSFNFNIVPGRKGIPFCVQLSKDVRGSQLQSCQVLVGNQTITLKSAVVSFNAAEGGLMQCDNGEIIETIRWWLVDELLMIYTCEDHPETDQHDTGFILVLFRFSGTV